ncbi:hypothetical protein AMTR_s00051p00069140 [Amborella trichopoda]|uniref:Uncharacterized protein n=1 Tax=Amborella trichopoda TaxID=13333 RepID=U5CTN4_AMBTC|nr:hypothetical protein AMTR_s00051p00069140 [Amborella trichopoda]
MGNAVKLTGLWVPAALGVRCDKGKREWGNAVKLTRGRNKVKWKSGKAVKLTRAAGYYSPGYACR